MRTERERAIYLLSQGTDIAAMTEILRGMEWRDSDIRNLYDELSTITTTEQNQKGKFCLRFDNK